MAQSDHRPCLEEMLIADKLYRHETHSCAATQVSNHMCHVQLNVGTCVSTILHEMAWLQEALTCLSIWCII